MENTLDAKCAAIEFFFARAPGPARAILVQVAVGVRDFCRQKQTQYLR